MGNEPSQEQRRDAARLASGALNCMDKLADMYFPQWKYKHQCVLDSSTTEGISVFTFYSMKSLREVYAGDRDYKIIRDMKESYDEDHTFVFKYKKEKYFCADCKWPRINGAILELADNTVEYHIPIKRRFKLKMFRQAQFNMYMDLKDKCKYAFGFDTCLLKIEISSCNLQVSFKSNLDLKIIFLLREDKFLIYYTNYTNSIKSFQNLLEVIDKYIGPLLDKKFRNFLQDNVTY